jgi:hypothetical protein
MLPPLTPHAFWMYTKDRHYTRGRFIPLEYMRLALAAIRDHPVEKATEMDLVDIFDHINKLYGVSYDEVHESVYRRYGESHELLSSWDPADFECKVVDGVLYSLADGKRIPEEPGESMAKLVDKARANDNLVLQNYGKPYAKGRPGGTYYKYATSKRINSGHDEGVSTLVSDSSSKRQKPRL